MSGGAFGADGMMRGQHAESVGLDLERAIEAGAHVLHRDGRGQIDDLLGVEPALEFLEDVVRNVDRRLGHFLDVAQRGALGGREQGVLDVVGNRRKLLFTDSYRAAAGSIDIDSENAADQLRRAQTHQPFQDRVGHFRSFDGLRENRHGQRYSGPIRPRLVRIQHLADTPLHHPDQRLQ